MSAAYALSGDVILIREPLPVQDRDGGQDELTPGYYAIVGQFGDRLAVVRTGEDEEGTVIAYGKPYAVWASVLETEAVGITYLKVGHWERPPSSEEF